jgi:hypothetical protein
MATVYGTKRKPIGKVMPHISGSIAAQIGNRRLGLFTSEDLAVMAILDCAAPALTIDAYCEWLEELLAEEPVADGLATFRIDADLR